MVPSYIYPFEGLCLGEFRGSTIAIHDYLSSIQTRNPPLSCSIRPHDARGLISNPLAHDMSLEFLGELMDTRPIPTFFNLFANPYIQGPRLHLNSFFFFEQFVRQSWNLDIFSL